MIAQIPILLIGILVAVIGVINMTGNINSLHSYHRHRVREEDRIPFGRMVGSGTLTVGVGMIAFAVLMMIHHAIKAEALVWIATAAILLCIVAGLAISFWGMIKYNNGIF